VGVHGDALVNQLRGMNLPLMNLHERVLSVLGCRYVDDVLMDAPHVPTPSMMETLKISEFVVRKRPEAAKEEQEQETARLEQIIDSGIVTFINVHSEFDIRTTIQKIQRNHESFQAKYERKKSAEQQFYQEKRKQDKQQ
jgi:ethanolamine-phosphate cytidylyltransferase